jgi:hypothetical protein
VARSLSIALVLLALLQTRSCGFTPVDRRGEGEACARTSECEAGLECRGGVCMLERIDGASSDASPGDRDGGS